MGIDVKDVLAQDPELLQRQLYQQEMQRLNPQGNAAGAIGAVLGRGLGNVTRGRGFFDVADPALQKVAKIKQLQTAALEASGGDPVKTLEALSKSLMQDPELAPLTMQVQEQLMQMRPKPGETKVLPPGALLVDSRGEVVFTAPNRDEDPLKAASRDKMQEIYSKYPDTPAGRAQAAVEFRNWDNQFKERVSAAANVPGSLKVTDVAGARKLTEDIVGKDKERLTTVGLLKTNIATIRSKNPTAVPQLERGLVKLVGDSQIGQNEVRQALGASGFPQSVIEGVNRFFSGQPTDLKLDQVEASIEAIEDYYANRLNKGLGTASSILKDTSLPKSTVDTIIGQPYTSAVEKKNRAKITALQGKDKEAYNWAKANATDPRSAAILNKLGVR